MISIVGYDLLNNGADGLRFAWKENDSHYYIESASFINRTKGKKENVCGYTTSVSKGCILSANGLQCSFCRTGNSIPFGGKLSYRDIAKQNVFMVLADMNCSDHPELRNKSREFAYMGQGEPGFSYEQVRLAIELTNSIMRELNQTVTRHVFATCGVPNAIRRYTEDTQSFYTERVTLHFSLHATQRRSELMPINNLYPYQKCIDELNKVYDISGEKPCVGIMLFNHFMVNVNSREYSNSISSVLNIIRELDPNKCRLSFCEYNPSPDYGSAEEYPQAISNSLLEIVREKGFEAKLFSSFGKEKLSACGMLGGKGPDHKASNKWMELDVLAEHLVTKNDNISK